MLSIGRLFTICIKFFMISFLLDLVYCTKLLENAKAEENTNNIEQQEMQSDFIEVYNGMYISIV